MDEVNADDLSFFNVHSLQPPPLVHQIVEFRQQSYACIGEMDNSLTGLHPLLPGAGTHRQRGNAIVCHAISHWTAFYPELPTPIPVGVIGCRVKGCFWKRARSHRREKRWRREEDTRLHQSDSRLGAFCCR